MTKCKKKPSNYKIFSRQPTIKESAYRWVNEVTVQSIRQYKTTTYITINLEIGCEQDRSLATVSCFRNKTTKRQAMTRIDDTRVYTFQTAKGYECLDKDGNPVSLKEGDVVTIRFTPIVRNDTAYFALECVMVH